MRLLEAIGQKIIDDLLKLCKQELELSELPEITLIDEPFIHAAGKNTFGMFDGNKILVVTKDRHPVDVARTLAHELTHWKQRTESMEMSGEDGSDAENQANAIAGIIMRKFGEKYPDYFINSLP